MTSELDEHEFEQAREKVHGWQMKTSGLGSELEDNEDGYAE